MNDIAFAALYIKDCIQVSVPISPLAVYIFHCHSDTKSGV